MQDIDGYAKLVKKIKKLPKSMRERLQDPSEFGPWSTLQGTEIKYQAMFCINIKLWNISMKR